MRTQICTKKYDNDMYNFLCPHKPNSLKHTNWCFFLFLNAESFVWCDRLYSIKTINPMESPVNHIYQSQFKCVIQLYIYIYIYIYTHTN